MLTQTMPLALSFSTSTARRDVSPASSGLEHAAQSLIGPRIERLAEACCSEGARSVTEYFLRFRRQICADCEGYGDPNCACPLMALPLTADGRNILDREQREREIRPTWYDAEAPETD